MLFNVCTPLAYAVANDNTIPLGNVIVSNQFAVCIFQGTSYSYCIYLNSATGRGSFAISYTEEPDYLYEYYFTIPSSNISVDSSAFWENVLTTNCMDNQSCWSRSHIPSTVITLPNSSATTFSASDTAEEEFIPLLERYFKTSEYTGKIIHTASRQGILFHVYEDLEFSVSQKDLYFISKAISVASFITGVLGLAITSTLLAALGFAYSETIPSETEVGTHELTAQFVRYVKRMDSSIWLNYTLCIRQLNGYYISGLELYSIDEGYESFTYSESEYYFYAEEEQINDGYFYYLTQVS